MSIERVSFRNSRGLELRGLLHGELADVAVVSCHGMLSSKDGNKHPLLAEALEAVGLPVLRFDFAGRGESEGSLFDISYSNELEDLQAAIEYLAGRGVERIGLFGSSMGGTVAILAAARDERIVAIATLAAQAHPQAIEERHPREASSWRTQGFVETDAGRIGRSFFDDCRLHDIVSAVRVIRAPMLVLHGERDDVVPPSDAHDIASAARNVSMEVVLGADHQFSSQVHLRPVLQRIREFLKDHLLNGRG